uniref:phospholipase A2 n=1 Tax=Setaria digitata TaxID=48799 RepID=A0A915PK47_9BILA
MFGILKKVHNIATVENCEMVMNACSRAASAVLSTKSEKVEGINPSKFKTFKKCDNSFMFSLYMDKPKDGTYYIIYLPRTLSIWRTRRRDEAELLRDQLNNLKLLINILEKINSKLFVTELEQLRDSILENPDFSDIHHAAACNFPKVIRGLCEDHPNIVNEASTDGYYPIHIAVKNDALEAVQVLLSLGADVAKQDCHSRNAVHYSAENSSEILECLQLLVDAQNFSDAVDALDEDGISPLCLAIRSGKAKCVEILLDANCSTGPFRDRTLASVVISAAPSPDLPRIVDLLLIRAPQFLIEEISGSSMLLHEDLELRLLYHILGDLGSAVNINARNSLGQTPLYCSVARNNISQSFALLTYNADVNIGNCDGETPLHFSSKSGNVKLVKLLLCFGASVQLRNNRGATALDVAKDNEEVMMCLRLFVDLPSVVRPLNNAKRHQMTPKDRSQLINVISFDGGGIRGLVILQTLIHIENFLGHSVMKHFQWLCGTSAGAIIALGLAKGFSLRRCQSLYMSMKDELFIGKRPYSDKIIECILQKNFGEETTMAQLGPKRVSVTASYVRENPPALKMFRNYTLPLSKAENEALGFDDPSENLVWKCARYSSAAPTFFSPKDNFVDGGLMANNPTLDLLSDIHTYNVACMKAKKETVHVGCILSLGTGQAPPETLNSLKWNFSVPGGIVESVRMVQDLVNLKNLLVEQTAESTQQCAPDHGPHLDDLMMLCGLLHLSSKITASNGACVIRARSWAHDQFIPFFRFSPLLSSQVELDERNNEVILDLLWDTEKMETGPRYIALSSKETVLSTVRQTITFQYLPKRDFCRNICVLMEDTTWNS